MQIKDLVKYIAENGFDSLPKSFTDECSEQFVLDNRATNSLNNLLDSNFLAVYRSLTSYEHQWRSEGFSWDNETAYIVTSKGKVICMTNSEWASFGVEK